MPRDWTAQVDQLTPVQKLVHLAMRYDVVEQERIALELTRIRRRAYEQELTIQARRAGCTRRTGLLTNGQILSELNAKSKEDAASIANTYNFDLAGAIQAIASEVPTANRHVYANRLQGWEAKRLQWKGPQVQEYTEGWARSRARADFMDRNRATGSAMLEPKPAVCPVCQGWVSRGRVPLAVANNNPPPYHVNCPHYWQTNYDTLAAEECEVIWMGE